MTEIERIIKKGTITSDYLRPEVQCDFYVDENRKKLWAISLDLLCELDKVCKEHNIRYFLGGGTLLGAVRHKGFIPWDDDIDLFMMREDYEKFIKLGGDFSEPYFLQNAYTDPNFLYSCTRLRNSNTSYIIKKFKYQKFNQGIYITVFPIDNWKLENGEFHYNHIKELLRDNSAYMRKSIPNPDDDDIKRIKAHSGRNPLDVYNEVHQTASQYRNENTQYLSLAVCTVYRYEKNIYFAEDFAEAIPWNFDFLKVYIPKGYDRILKTVYGDYMTFPPVAQRGEWHSGAFIDPDKPYSYYLTDERIETI